MNAPTSRHVPATPPVPNEGETERRRLEELVGEYVAKSYRGIIPVSPRRKNPVHTGWPERHPVLTAEDVRREWRHAPRNIGLRHDHTVVIDVDIQGEAEAFLQQHSIDLTALQQGPCITRPDGNLKPVFRLPHDLEGDPTTSKHQNAAGQMVVEIRTGGGAQDILPGSVHPDGGHYEWANTDGHIPRFDALPAAPPALIQLAVHGFEGPTEEDDLPTKGPSRPYTNEAKARFRREAEVGPLLAELGYVQKGRRYLAPNSKTGEPGVTILTAKDDSAEIAHNHHGSGTLSPETTYNAFELLLVIHGGDEQAALKDARSRLGMPPFVPGLNRIRLGSSASKADDPGLADTDVANAKRLEHLLAGKVAYTPGIGWLMFTGTHWQRVTDEHLIVYAQRCLSQQVYREAAAASDKASAADDKDERKTLNATAETLLKWANRCESRRVIVDAVALLKSRVLTPTDQWDRHPFLLNVENGTIDLRTGELRPHDPRDRITKLASVKYDLNAQHTAVDATRELLQIDGREDYMQASLGACLTGETPNENLWLLIGGAGTGKSTLLEAAAAVLGPGYAAHIDTATLIETRFNSNPGSPRPDLLALQGARLAIGRELPNNARLRSADIKALTGGDTIVARAPYGREPVAFRPQFKLFIHSNYTPKVDWDDEGVQRRLVQIPFTAKPTKPNPSIKRALLEDPTARSAMLNWLLKGARAWIESGYQLDAPDLVREATAQYWRENDPFHLWAEDNVRFDQPEVFTLVSDIYSSYKDWAKSINEKPASIRSLGQWLRKQKCVSKRGSDGRGWLGVQLIGQVGGRITVGDVPGRDYNPQGYS
jgi:putative DNA primase/helicase